jgi:hypothetical protein
MKRKQRECRQMGRAMHGGAGGQVDALLDSEVAGAAPSNRSGRITGSDSARPPMRSGGGAF